VPEVSVVTLRSRPVALTRELSGRTSAFLVAEVRPQVRGIIKERLFTEGGYVRSGQALYQLDDAAYRAQYEAALANLRKSEAALQVARSDADRYLRLARIQVVSAQDNERAIAAQVQAEADVAAARAAVKTNGVTLAYARMVAPISGRIGRSTVTQGALVTADQKEALVTIQQLDPIYVEVNQSSNEWLELRQAVDNGRVRADGTAAKARILLENGSAYTHDGRLQFTDATVDPTTGNLLLRVIVPNPQLLLLPGMYVRAVVDEGSMREGLLVPQQGIARDPKGNARALLVDLHGKVEARAVRVGRAIGSDWLVEDGLVAGDRVILEGTQRAQPGELVHAVEQTLAAERTGPDTARVALPGSATH
jgi:membrane fusion protein (multidrug efflux system)